MSEEKKTITYANGTVLTKKKKGNRETWTLNNKSLATINFTMDLAKCENVQFEKEKDRDKIVKKVKVAYGEERKLFTLVKTPPFKMEPKFKKKETPISVEEQREIMKEEVQALEEECKLIDHEMMKMPFEVMELDDLRKAVRDKGFDHFIDSHFPPNDTSIYNSIKQGYPYKKIVHWRRPKDFMKGEPKVFSDIIRYRNKNNTT